MKYYYLLIPVIALFSTASSCGGEKPDTPVPEANISTAPVKLECSAEAQTLTLAK